MITNTDLLTTHYLRALEGRDVREVLKELRPDESHEGTPEMLHARLRQVLDEAIHGGQAVN